MKKMTKEYTKQVMETTIKRGNINMYLHCKSCLPKIPNGQSPDDYMQYEATSCQFTYPDKKTANLFVLWCKRCKQVVWDSRHLQPHL
jgi:hypothetical protein